MTESEHIDALCTLLARWWQKITRLEGTIREQDAHIKRLEKTIEELK